MSPTGSPTSESISTPSSVSGNVSSLGTPSSSISPAAAATPYEQQNRLTDSDREKLKDYNISPPGSPRDETNYHNYNVDRLPIGEMTDSDRVKLKEMGISPPGTPEAPAVMEDFMPEVATHMVPSAASVFRSEPPPVINDRRDDVLVTTKTYTTAPTDSSDSSSSHVLEKFGESPPDGNDEAAHNDYYKRFVEFHQNPTMSRNRRPFAKGRHRTHKCKPCKRRRACTRKTKKRHYKKGRKSHKRKSHSRRR
jgi:hypothetical protein